MIHDRPSIIERLPEGYHRLFDRAVEVFEADERVRALWLSGSLARGTADAASDLDLLVAVADDSHEEFARTWSQWLHAISPTVLAQEQPWSKGSLWSITPGFERFDVVVEPVSALPSTFFRTRTVVFDHDQLDALVPAPGPAPGASADRVSSLVESWFHFSAMLETILVREDWLLAAEHLHFLGGLVYQLCAEANAPLPPMGVKQWSTKLTDGQRVLLEQLPTAARSPEELSEAHLALSRAFLGIARPLAAELRATWPEDLEAAAAAHLGEILNVAEPYPD